MSENLVFQPSAAAVAATWTTAAQYDEMPTRARSAIRTASGNEQAKRLDWIKAPTRIKNTSLRVPRRLDQMVRGRRAQRLRQLHRPAPRRRAATRVAHHLGRRYPRHRRQGHLSQAARAASAASPMC